LGYSRAFKGGVHPDDSKVLSQDKEIERLDAPEKVYIPLLQHIGAPCKAVVKKGDSVKKGQLVGAPQGYVSVPVHSSVSGTVEDILLWNHPIGRKIQTVVIKNDGADEWVEGANVWRDMQAFGREQLQNIIRDAGIAGMGGAAFPTYVKLNPPEETPIDTLIINGAECEPYLTADYRLMLEHSEEILSGTAIIMRMLGLEKATVAVEANKPEAAEKMTQAAKAFPGIEVKVLPVKYPQGAEKQLIKAVADRTVPAGALPMAVAALVDNVGTAKAIYEAVAFNRPLIERVVTVTGEGVRNPANFLVPIGTPVAALFDRCEVLPQANKFIAGGPMMGIAFSDFEIPVVKGLTGVVVLREAKEYEHMPCIRCGKCVRACPMGLNPSLLSLLVEAGRIQEARDHHLLDCYECGCCAYQCPAKRMLVHQFKFAKAELAAEKARAAKKE